MSDKPSDYPPNYGQQPPPPSGYPPNYNQHYPQPGYAPQSYENPGYNPGYAQGAVFTAQPVSNTVVISTGIAVPPRLGAYPTVTTCFNCKATVTTQIHHENGCFTWLMAGIILFLGLWLGCCLIPFCVSSCKDVVHVCPNCKTVQGRYARM